MAQENNTQVNTAELTEVSPVYKENNLRFLKDQVTRLGLGDDVHSRMETELTKNKPEVSISTRITMDDRTQEKMSAKLKFSQNDKGTYNLDGYLATLHKPGLAKEDEKSQFITIFKGKGFDIDQAKILLEGGSVLHTIKDQKNNETRTVYTSLNFNQKTASGNYKRINTPKEKIDVFKLLGRYNVEGNEKEKEKMLQTLERGETVTVNSNLLNKRVNIRVEAAAGALVARDLTGEVVKRMGARVSEVLPNEDLNNSTDQAQSNRTGKTENQASQKNTTEGQQNDESQQQGKGNTANQANNNAEGQGKGATEAVGESDKEKLAKAKDLSDKATQATGKSAKKGQSAS